MRHAYLIIANENPHQLQKLITMIDDSRNDIYLIKDKKSDEMKYNFHTDFSIINYIDPINIYWGGFSIVNAELKLFKAASFGHYTYYHLLSGLDLPLDNQDTIHNFFDHHLNQEFLGYGNYNNLKKMNNDIYVRTKHHFFRKNYKSKNFIEKVYRGLERRVLKYLFVGNVPKNKIGYASQWLSIDDALVKVIVNSINWISNTFKYSVCPDELFVPTLINYNPSLLKRIHYNGSYDNTSKEFTGNLRYIHFNNAYTASPCVWTINDFSNLINARNKGYLFSRKFNSKIDNNIVNKIFKMVMN